MIVNGTRLQYNREIVTLKKTNKIKVNKFSYAIMIFMDCTPELRPRVKHGFLFTRTARTRSVVETRGPSAGAYG